MAATAGTVTLVGVKSGQTYTVDAYVPDAAGGIWSWSPTGLSASTSPAYWKAPEACLLTDVSIHAAPTSVGGIVTLSGAVYPGKTMRWTNQLDSITFRPKFNILIPAGEQMSILNF